MGTEIDRLELVVEAQASKANKELDVLVSKLGNLDQVLSGIDFDNFKGSATVVENLSKQVNKVSSQIKKVTPEMDTKDLKKGLKDTKSIMEQFKDVGKDIKFEGTYDKLIKEIQKAEKQLDRLSDKEAEFHDIGRDKSSTTYIKMQRDISKTLNYLDMLKSKQREIDSQNYKATMALFDGKEAEASSPQTSDKVDYDSRTVPMGKTKMASEMMPKVDTSNVVKELTSLSAKAKSILDESLSDFEMDIDKASFDEISGELTKLESKYRSVQEAERKFLASGGSENTQTYKGLLYQLELISGKLDIAKAKQASFNHSMLSASNMANVFKAAGRGAIGAISGIGKGMKTVGELAKTGLSKGLKTAGSVAKTTTSAIGGMFKNLASGGSRALKGFTGNLKFSLGQMLKMAMVRKLVNMAVTGIIQGFKVGADNLAQYSRSFNNNLSMIKSALTQLKNSFATAFAPILSVVAPILTTLINMLSKAVTAIGMFFAALTGAKMFTKAVPVTESFSSGLGSVGDSAAGANKQAKELKKTLLGFDQINALNDNSDSGNDGGSGGGGGGGGGVGASDMFTDVPVDSKVKDFADMFKKAWEKGDFTEIGKIVGEKLNNALKSIPWDKIQSTLNKVAKSVATFLNGFIEATDWELVGRTIAKGINTAFGMVNTFVTNFKWDKAGKALGDGINGFMNDLDWGLIRSTATNTASGIVSFLNNAISTTNWKKVGETFGQAVNTFVDFGYTFVKNFEWAKFGSGVATGLTSAFKTIDTGKIGATIGLLIGGLIKMIAAFIDNADWKMIKEKLKAGFKSIFSNINLESDTEKLLGTLFSAAAILTVVGRLAPLISGIGKIGGALQGVITVASGSGILAKVGTALAGLGAGPVLLVAGVIAAIVAALVDLWKTSEKFQKVVKDVGTNIKKHFVDGLNKVKTAITPVWNKIKDLGKTLYDLYEVSLKPVVAKIATLITQLTGGRIAVAIDLISTAFSTLATILGGAVDIMKGAAKVLTGLITFDGDKIKEGFGDIGEGIVSGLIGGIVDFGKGVWKAIKGVFSNVVTAVKEFFGIHSPSTVFAGIGGFIMDGLFGGLKDKLGTILTFFKELPGKIKNALGNAKNWLKEKGSDAIEGIKNGWEAVKDSKLGQTVSKIGGFVKDKIGDVKTTVTSRGKEIIEGLKNGYESVKESGLLRTVSTLRNTVKDRIGDVKTTVAGRGKEIISGLKEGYDSVKENGLLKTVSALKETVKTRIGNIASTVKSKGSDIISGLKLGYNGGESFTSVVSQLGNKVKSAIGSLLNVGKDVISSFITGFKSIKIPLPHLNFGTEVKTILGVKVSLPKFSGVSWYAKGGFPNMGELFVANEAGPEMIGKMGNRNVVANNNQIVDGIKHGVSDAMVAIMMAMQGGQQKGNEAIEIPLIISGEELARAVHNGKERLIERGIIRPEFA